MHHVTTATRGRGWGRGRDRAQIKACETTPRDGETATTRARARTASKEPPIAPEMDYVPDQVVLFGLSQVPEGLISSLVLQHTMVWTSTYFNG